MRGTRRSRRQIKDCALFVPIISANTQARREGYFRLEWKLAAQRTHTIADGTPFLLPVVIDDMRDGDALVPEEFRAVQWTKARGAAPPPAFYSAVKAALSGGTPVGTVPPKNPAAPDAAGPPSASNQSRRATRRRQPLIASIVIVAVTIGVWATLRPQRAPAHLNLARVLRADGRLDEALAE